MSRTVAISGNSPKLFHLFDPVMDVTAVKREKRIKKEKLCSGLWLAVALLALVAVVLAEEVVPSDSNVTSSSVPVLGQSGGKRRVGGVIKYKKFSVNINSTVAGDDVSSSSGDESVVTFIQEGNKTIRRTKLKSSPQTMIYKPTKAANNKINPAVLAAEESTTSTSTSTTTTLAPEVEQQVSTTTSSSTTEKPRIWIFASTTEEPEAFSPEAPVGFNRPTSRNRVRVIKRPVNRPIPDQDEVEEEEEETKSKGPVRLMTRVRIPGGSTTTTTTTKRPVVRSTTTTRSTTTPEPTTTTKFIRLTRRPSKTPRPVPTTESIPVQQVVTEVEHLQGESSIRKGLSGISAAQNKETHPPSSTLEVENDLESIRQAKYEAEKAKQLERLKEGRPTVRRPTEEPSPPPRARLVSSAPTEQEIRSTFEELIDFARPPPSNYGQRLPATDPSVAKSPSGPPIDPEAPKLLYTPPVYEYRPPSGYLTAGYLPRGRVAASQHHIRIPPVTYEPPHEDYQPPSPPPPPLRIYVPPTEDFRAPVINKKSKCAIYF